MSSTEGRVLTARVFSKYPRRRFEGDNDDNLPGERRFHDDALERGERFFPQTK
jgi:hypothetical protein